MSEGPVLTLEPDGATTVGQTVESIMKMLTEGMSVQLIAARLQLDPAKVLAVEEARQRGQRVEEDNSQKMSRWLDQVDEIADLAHWQAKADPTPNHVYAYTAIMETARGLVGDMESRRDTAKLRADFEEQILRPMCEAIVGAMTEKLRDSKAALLGVTATERHQEVNLQIDGILRALGTSIKDSLSESRNALDKVLVDKPQRPGTAMMKSSPKKRH